MNNQYITSFKAINYGLLIVVFSALIFMIVGIILGVYYVNIYNWHPSLIIFFFMPVSILFFWPFWSYILVKWKIWSYQKVEDIKLFELLAAKRGLIYPKNHFYSKYEIISRKDKNLILEILKKRNNEEPSKILANTIKNTTINIKTFFNKPILTISINGVYIKGEYLSWNKFSKFNLKWDKFGKRPDTWIEYKFKEDSEKHKLYLNYTKMNNTRLDYYIESFKKINLNLGQTTT